MYQVQAEDNGSTYSASEEEVIGVQHLLAEPECSKGLVESILGFQVFNPQKCFNTEDFSCRIDYNHVKHGGGTQCSDLTQGDETKLEFIDDALQLTDEGAFHVTNNVPSFCEDYFVDEYLFEEYSLEDLDPRSQCLDIYGKDQVDTISDSPASSPVLEFTYNPNLVLLEKMTIHELHEAFKTMFGRETIVNDKQWLKHKLLFGLENLVTLKKNSNLVDYPLTYDDRNESKLSTSMDVLNNITKVEKEVSFQTLPSEEKGCSVITKRRSRKRTQRYVEESWDLRSKFRNNFFGVPYKHSRDKSLGLGSHSKTCEMGNGDESFEKAIKVPFGSAIKKEQFEEPISFPGHDDESVPNKKQKNDVEYLLKDSTNETSEDDDLITERRKGRIQRKKHKYWTVSETMKLIKGVSCCGVGKWSEIKHLFFSPASHRTPVDLKDKWRNLLRASCINVDSSRKVKQGNKHEPRQIKSILRCVRELSVSNNTPTLEFTNEKLMSLSTTARG